MKFKLKSSILIPAGTIIECDSISDGETIINGGSQIDSGGIITPDTNLSFPFDPEFKNLVRWPGDEAWCRRDYDSWELYKEYNNDSLYQDYMYILRLISRIVWERMGVVTVFLDLSSIYIVWDPVKRVYIRYNGHPQDTHEISKGADIRYHGWPIGWNKAATHYWFTLALKCLPEFMVFMAEKEAKTILSMVPRYGGQINSYGDESNAHGYSVDNASHIHLILRFFKTNVDEVRKLEGEVKG